MFDKSDIVYSYTSEQAVEDGVLHDVSYMFSSDGFSKRRWYVTNGIVEAIRHRNDGRSFDEKLVPLVLDAVRIVNAKIQEAVKRFGDNSAKNVLEHTGGGLITEGLEGNVTGQTVWIGINENGGWTLIFPRER